MDEINRQNLSQILDAFIKKENITTRQASKVIGCSGATLERLLAQGSIPSDEMIKQVGIMTGLGFKKYSKLSKAEKEKISATIGTIGGGLLGFSTISSAISASGVVVGLSVTGVTSGLAAIGGLVGGGMVAGVMVATCIPIAAAAAGYGLVKGVKFLINTDRLNKVEHDLKWEAAE